MADYTVTTNAKRESTLTRAAQEAGATKVQVLQVTVNNTLDGLNSTYSATDRTEFWKLAEIATGAARQAALAALVASVAKPQVDAVADQSHAVGAPVELQVVATDPADNQQLKYVATNLPPGMSMNQDGGGLIAGTPTTPGVYNVSVRITKLLGVFTDVAFGWTIT
jgi:hypothetical protein